MAKQLMVWPPPDDEEEPEWDESGDRLISVPDGWVVAYTVTTIGYYPPNRALQEYSETIYGPVGMEADELAEALGAPTMWFGGRGEESDISMAETPLRRADLPKKARFI
jgi:hypothetical protein